MFGIDISEWQNGLSLARAKAEGIEFVIIRTNDGTHRDLIFNSHLQDAEANGLLIAAYWFVRNPSEGSSFAQQVDVIDAQMAGRRDIPIWLDIETPAGFTGSLVHQAKAELQRRGYRCPGIYTYVPYWESMAGGEPSLNGLGSLWVAAYGANRHGSPAALYPGDGHAQWRYPLGDKLPDIWQYGSNAAVAGFPSVDINYFRGTRDQLKALFYGGQTPAQQTHSTTQEEETMFEKIKQFITAFVGPIGSDTKDIRQQLTGGRDIGQYPGWPQLGTDAQGRNLTMVDAIAALRHDVATLDRKLTTLTEGK